VTARCLFLDRDGVINVDDGYVHEIERFRFMPGIFPLARSAVEMGWRLVVVTNQSGIGRGYYDEDAFQALTAWMSGRFEAEGAPLTDVLFCPFHPEAASERYRAADHPWRKPNPGMILEARRRHGLDLAASALIGDRDDDIAAGAKAGVGLLVRLNNGPIDQETRSSRCRCAEDLFHALRILRDWNDATHAR
jgi:D-glycero-D-manno-heptose 1,7-bisphosphate phosphatase